MSAPQKKATHHRKPKPSYNMYVSKLLKKVDAEAGLSGDARAVAVSMTAHLVDQLANETKGLMAKTDKKQVQARDVQAAAKAITGNDSHAVAVKLAMDAYAKNTKGSKTERAELIFPVARIHSMMKAQKVGSSVSPLAAVALAATVQDEIHHVFDVANQLRKDDKVARVTAQHIKRALDSEKTPLKHFKGVVKHGGVSEHVNEALLPKKSKKRAAESEAPATKRAKK